MNEIANLIEEDILATFPSVEEAERELDEFLAKRAAKLAAGIPLVEGVDYGFPSE